MRKAKASKKKKKVSGHRKKDVVASGLNKTIPTITPEETARRAHIEKIFEQIEVLRLRTKKLPKGVTIDSLITEGRRF